MDNNNSEYKPPELNNNNKIESFEIQQPKKIIPNIPSVLNDIKKNTNSNTNNYNNDRNNNNNNNNVNITFNENENDKFIQSNDNNKNESLLRENNKNYYENILDYIKEKYYEIINNKNISIILNPFQNESKNCQLFYKICCYITLFLLFLVIFCLFYYS